MARLRKPIAIAIHKSYTVPAICMGYGTGHSLGGGLAGLLGSIYHQTNVKIYDAMDFVVAAQCLYNSSSTDHARA